MENNAGQELIDSTTSHTVAAEIVESEPLNTERHCVWGNCFEAQSLARQQKELAAILPAKDAEIERLNLVIQDLRSELIVALKRALEASRVWPI
jgi:hypothetical protein